MMLDHKTLGVPLELITKSIKNVCKHGKCTKRNMKDECEYTTKLMVSHEDKGGNTRYVIKWYRFTADNDTIEPSPNILRHFMKRFWRKINKAQMKHQKQEI